MARDLLCKWLDLPPSPWPPDHYALLGLSPGEGTSEEIEQRVLERMEGLRHYQLMHPEAVTEGMNLLAQAMISLTDPSARHEYDRDLGVETREADQAPEPEEEEETRESPAIAAPPEPPSSARVAVWSKRAPPPPPPPSGEVEAPLPEPIQIFELEEEPETLEEAAADEEEALEIPRVILADEEEPRQKGVDLARDERRRLYREIVRIRRVIRIWEQLQGYLDNAAKTFTRRMDALAFMNCLADLRPMLESVSGLIGGPNEPGNLIASLARQQLVVDMFRSFLPGQREALADDCREAHDILIEHYRRLRRDAKRMTKKGFRRRVVYPFYRHLAARPEWLFLFLGLVALTIAFIRSVP